MPLCSISRVVNGPDYQPNHAEQMKHGQAPLPQALRHLLLHLLLLLHGRKASLTRHILQHGEERVVGHFGRQVTPKHGHEIRRSALLLEGRRRRNEAAASIKSLS